MPDFAPQDDLGMDAGGCACQRSSFRSLRRMKIFPLILLLSALLAIPPIASAQPAPRTTISIVGEDFQINGRPTYEGRTWRGHRIEGLLMNSRMVQGIFD